ncbi:hypothetical protein [Acidianus sp. HS-5]|uniref:hypothetical protein n=1 Tax=Acidianus sp. HS-5 TaxID=2886040 RepID=UPI001F2B6A76|nr:hypothetical protein [Acidianus sp. HS-5]BDC19493.1 hypothetical protein HS5_23830 [Acidianus sp. HS-5]
MKGLIAGLIIVIIILAAVYYLYTEGYFYSVKINGIYVTLRSTFLSIEKSIHVSYSNVSISAHGDQDITIKIFLKNDNLLFSDELTNVTVSHPFTLISATPVPSKITPGDNETLCIVIKTPMCNYAGSVDIILYVTKA